jgi:hypothetical protein
MATDAVRYRRQGREESARAQKARRDKIILGVGCALLAGIGAFEGPKTLKRLQGSSASSTAPAIIPGSPAVAVPAAPPKSVSLKPLARFAAKDPFVPQVTALPGKPTTTPVLPNNPPTVRTSHFIEKDPFVQQISLDATAPSTGGSKPSGSKAVPVAGSGAYIVVIASVPIGSGRADANHEAAVARAHGVPSVKVVDSSKYPTLREGYYAVYSGPYSTLAKALAAVGHVRGLGYVSAYTRRLGH